MLDVYSQCLIFTTLNVRYLQSVLSFYSWYVRSLQSVHFLLMFTASVLNITVGMLDVYSQLYFYFTVSVYAEYCRDGRDCSITICPSNSSHIACHGGRCTCDAFTRKFYNWNYFFSRFWFCFQLMKSLLHIDFFLLVKQKIILRRLVGPQLEKWRDAVFNVEYWNWYYVYSVNISVCIPLFFT